MIRKTAIALLVSSLFSLYALDFDWGGVLQNSTDASSVGGLSLTQVDSLSLWMELNFQPMFNFKASAGYRFKYDGAADEPVSHIPEFGSFQAYGSNDTISWKAGRYAAKDLNGNLFSTIWDGAQFGYKNTLLQFRGALGFTGWVFQDNSSVAVSSKDYREMINNAPFAAPHLAEMAEVAFYVLPGDGSVYASFLAQQDLWADNAIEAGQGRLHSFYLNAGLKGRLYNTIFYNFYVTGETGIYQMPADDSQLLLLAMATGLKVDIPLKARFNPFITAEFFYSTGGTWDERSDYEGSDIDPAGEYIYQYTPFTMNNKGYIYSIGAGNLFYGDLKFSMSPLSILSVALESLTLFRAVDGPVSALPVSESGSSSLFLGEELTLAVNIRPLSDLGFQLKGGVFIPNSDVVDDGVQYKFGGFFSLNF